MKAFNKNCNVYSDFEKYGLESFLEKVNPFAFT